MRKLKILAWIFILVFIYPITFIICDDGNLDSGEECDSGNTLSLS